MQLAIALQAQPCPRAPALLARLPTPCPRQPSLIEHAQHARWACSIRLGRRGQGVGKRASNAGAQGQSCAGKAMASCKLRRQQAPASSSKAPARPQLLHQLALRVPAGFREQDFASKARASSGRREGGAGGDPQKREQDRATF
jgi:hypothetical protein